MPLDEVLQHLPVPDQLSGIVSRHLVQGFLIAQRHTVPAVQLDPALDLKFQFAAQLCLHSFPQSGIFRGGQFLHPVGDFMAVHLFQRVRSVFCDQHRALLILALGAVFQAVRELHPHPKRFQCPGCARAFLFLPGL